MEDTEISFSQIKENFHHFVLLPSDKIPSNVKVVVFFHFVYHLKQVDSSSIEKVPNSIQFFYEFESYFVAEYPCDLKSLIDYLSCSTVEDTTSLGGKGSLLWKISKVEPFEFSFDFDKVESSSLLLVGGTGKLIPLIISMYFPNLLHVERTSIKKRKVVSQQDPIESMTVLRKVMNSLKLPLERVVVINGSTTEKNSFLSSLYLEKNEFSSYFTDHKTSKSHVHCNVGQMIAIPSNESHYTLERSENTFYPHLLKAFSGGVVVAASNVLEKLSSDPSRRKKLTFSSHLNCFDVNEYGNLIGGCFGDTVFLFDSDIADIASALKETENHKLHRKEYISSICLGTCESSASTFIGSTLGVIRKWDVRSKSISSPLPKLPRSTEIVSIAVSENYIAQVSTTENSMSSIAYVIDERFPKEPLHQFFSEGTISSSFLQGDFFGVSYASTFMAWNLKDTSSPCNKHVLEGYTITECKLTRTMDSLVCSVFKQMHT